MTEPLSAVSYLRASAGVLAATADACAASITAAADALSACFEAGGKVMLCGNGGSAADCQHVAAEFVSLLYASSPRKALPAIALTTDSSIITARANDVGFGDVFARQIEALGRPGDVLLAFSTSGTSANVLTAATVAREAGLVVIGLTGSGATPLAKTADVVISVPSLDTPHIQEAHGAIGHALCALVEDRLFPAPGAGE